MAVLVSGVFGSSVLVGDIIWLCFVIASVVRITAFEGLLQFLVTSSSTLDGGGSLYAFFITNIARAALLQVSVEGYTFHVVLCAIPCAALIRAAGRDGLVVFALTARRHCIRVTAR